VRATKIRLEEQLRTEQSAEIEAELRRTDARIAATGGL